jgi:hypothetical protein
MNASSNMLPINSKAATSSATSLMTIDPLRHSSSSDASASSIVASNADHDATDSVQKSSPIDEICTILSNFDENSSNEIKETIKALQQYIIETCKEIDEKSENFQNLLKNDYFIRRSLTEPIYKECLECIAEDQINQIDQNESEQ